MPQSRARTGPAALPEPLEGRLRGAPGARPGPENCGFLPRAGQLCHAIAAMAISNMMRDDEDGVEGDPQTDPNHEAYWAERGMKRPQIVWERLTSSNNIETYRTRVPGGWLIMLAQEYRDCGGSFFYPDPTHRWDGTGFHG